METQQKSLKSYWLALFVLSLAAFALGFVLSTQDEQERFSDMGALAQNHLIYALQLKDDMAVIDWSKALEKLPSVAVFQVKDQNHIVAQGGNQTLFPAAASTGLTYHFPYQWFFHSELTSNGAPLALTVVFQDQKGPLFWGLCFLIAAWFVGFVLNFFKAKSIEVGLLQATAAAPSKAAALQKPATAHVDPQSTVLVLDRDYLICQATSKAAQSLGRELSSLTNSHFLDLLPDPAVMKAIDDGQETRLLKPFPSHPHLSVLLKPLPNGMALFLESAEGAERA